VIGKRSGIWFVLLLASHAPTAAELQPASHCEHSGELSFVCGLKQPEDLARIPDTRWLIASGFAKGSGLKLIDTDRRTSEFLYTSATAHERAPQRYTDCTEPPDSTLFNTQGISLRAGPNQQHTLYVTNHGGRETVEIFTIDARQHKPALLWNGCVLLPNGTAANSVASYADGTILITVLTHPGTTITDFVRGGATGGVYEWTPTTRSFRLLPGTQLPGNNGLETAPDDSGFYVVAFGWRSVLVFPRDLSTPARRIEAPGFMPDNIHWDSGRLILAGMQYDEPACGGVRKIIDGTADAMRCHRGYTVAQLNPSDLRFDLIAYAGPNAEFNGVSAAVVIDDELWLGSYQEDRVAVRKLPSIR
jgi:hypothetical protein